MTGPSADSGAVFAPEGTPIEADQSGIRGVYTSGESNREGAPVFDQGEQGSCQKKG